MAAGARNQEKNPKPNLLNSTFFLELHSDLVCSALPTLIKGMMLKSL